MVIDEETKVLEHTAVGAGYRYLVLAAPRIAAGVAPGQFVHVRVPALESSALRRPFSVFDADAAAGTLTLLYKTVGRGTAALNAVRAGDALKVEGPLGRGFPATCDGTALLVGGGYGVAPLYFLAKRLPRCRVFIGGRTKEDLLAVDRFVARGAEVRVATNDGSAGAAGFVTAPLDEAVAELRGKGEAFEFFTCGPDGLLKAVADRSAALGVPGWISMDRHMICGVGACFACIQKTVYGNARCCVDGPVFKAEELAW